MVAGQDPGEIVLENNLPIVWKNIEPVHRGEENVVRIERGEGLEVVRVLGVKRLSGEFHGGLGVNLFIPAGLTQVRFLV